MTLTFKRHEELISALTALPRNDISIDWNGLVHLQTANLLKGINKIGIPDLIILQNVLDNGLILFSADKHFKLMSDLFGFALYSSVPRKS